MLLLFAFIAGLSNAPIWLAFWCFLAMLDGNKAGGLLLIPLCLGLAHEPGWATMSLVLLWVVDAGGRRRYTPAALRPGVLPTP